MPKLPRLVQLASTAVATLLPAGRCRLCGQTSPAPLCARCRAAYLDPPRTRCPRCALALPASGLCGACLVDPPALRACLTLGDYAPPLDTLIQALKFGNEPALGRWLGRELGRRWLAQDLPRPALLLPLPLSARRLRERGYNQSWEIARAMAAVLDCPARSDLLQRHRDGPPQSSLPLRQRRTHVAGAFAAAPGVRGRELLLVDDVMTSGHSVGAAAAALRQAGAASVMLAVALRTPQRGRD